MRVRGGMRHGRPVRLTTPIAYGGNICRYVSMSDDEVGWRRSHSHRVWQAVAAVIGFAVAWDLGAKYYLVGGKEWVGP